MARIAVFAGCSIFSFSLLGGLHQATVAQTVTHTDPGPPPVVTTLSPNKFLLSTSTIAFTNATGFAIDDGFREDPMVPDVLPRLWVGRSRKPGTQRLNFNIPSFDDEVFDGRIPLVTPTICAHQNIEAHAIALRETVNGQSSCAGERHILNTWPAPGPNDLICRTGNPANTCVQCLFCSVVHGEGGDPTPTLGGEPHVSEPQAIATLLEGMPEQEPDPEEGDKGFGQVKDFIFSDKAEGKVRIRFRGPDQGNGCSAAGVPVRTLHTFGQTGVGTPMQNNCAGTPAWVDQVWSLRFGDFGGHASGVFGAYYVATMVTQFYANSQEVRRLTYDSVTDSFDDECFAALPVGVTNARGLEFDVYKSPSETPAGSGDLFVSEDSYNGHIWRIDVNENVTEFGTGFKRPNGMAFHQSGVMLVSHDDVSPGVRGNVLVVDGLRTMFNRGDADSDGDVDEDDGDFITDWLNGQGDAPTCIDAADVDDDGDVDANDVSYLGLYLTGYFSTIPSPFRGPDPGDWCDSANGIGVGGPGSSDDFSDPTPDLLGCESYRNCEIEW